MKLGPKGAAPKRALTSLVIMLVALVILTACGQQSDANLGNIEAITAPPTTPETVVATEDTATPPLLATNTPVPVNTITTVPNNTVTSTSVTPSPSAKTSPGTASATKTGSTATATIVAAPTPTKADVTNTSASPVVSGGTTTPASAALPALKKSVVLEPMAWERQTWNNCAPMSALMALSYYGVKLTQEECAKALRPGSTKDEPGDKHVRPEELVAFIQKKGFKIVMRENGTLDKLRALLSAGVPVITQQWLKEGDEIGHYRVARGYDTTKGIFIFNDAMDNNPKTIAADSLQDKLWKGFDRRYFPVYTSKQEAAVLAILGEDANTAANQTRALTSARTYSEANPKDIDAWRNLGYLYYAAGDCKSALSVWEQRLSKMLTPNETGPYNHFLWYQFWPVECYNKVGNYQTVIKIVPNEIEKAKNFAEARYEYAVALVNVGRKDEAIAQLKKGLLDDLNYQPNRDLLTKLGIKA